MEQSLSPDQKEHWLSWLAFIGTAGALVGLVTSPAVLSIGVIIVIVTGGGLWPLFRFIETRKTQTSVKELFLTGWSRYWGNKPAIFLGLFFLFHVVAKFYTYDDGAWLEDTRIKLPLFFVPLSFALLPAFSRRQVRIMIALMILAVTLVSVGTAVNYYLNKEAIDAAIAQSTPLHIFLGVNHIYFSFILAFTVASGVWWFRKGKEHTLLFKAEKWIMLALTAWNFYALHLFTARTGLVAFYIAAAGFVLYYFVRKRKYFVAIALIAAGAIAPVGGYFALSSLRNRVDNTVMDLTNYFNGGDPNYLSISTRMEAMKTAWHIFEDHPWIGTGVADLETEMENQYIRDGTCLISKNWAMPHNQFILFLAGLGVGGLLLFLLTCFVPWLDAKYRNSGMFLIVWLLMMSAMLAESLLERQVGVSFFVLFWFIAPLMTIDSSSESTSA